MRKVNSRSTRDARSAAAFALSLLAIGCGMESAESPTGSEASSPTGSEDETPHGSATDSPGGSEPDAFEQTIPAQPILPPRPASPTCSLPTPDKYRPNAAIGGGGAQFKDSDHFRVYGNGAGVDAALKLLEGAHKCFVEEWCFRSPGLAAVPSAGAVQPTTGQYYKFNLYAMSTLGSAAGVMKYDARAGLSYLQVITRSLGEARVTVHEFGHAMTLAEYGWVDQVRTGAWWETVANWVADTYITSSYCAGARAAVGTPTGPTIMDFNKVISQSNMMIVSDQNLYEAFPFITYLTNNPDGIQGLGKNVLLEMFRKHTRKNETPLHVLERIVAPVRVQSILGRYWAHMAYLDIGHPIAQEAFFRARARLNYANLDAAGPQTYRVKAARKPAYGGSNIIPLRGTGEITVRVTNLGNGRTESNFTATLAIRASSGTVRYVDLPAGAGQATLATGEEASLVVVNTPDQLYMYDAFKAAAPETTGLNYQVQLTGAVPAN